jgi:hypothetical protein
LCTKSSGAVSASCGILGETNNDIV